MELLFFAAMRASDPIAEARFTSGFAYRDGVGFEDWRRYVNYFFCVFESIGTFLAEFQWACLFTRKFLVFIDLVKHDDSARAGGKGRRRSGPGEINGHGDKGFFLLAGLLLGIEEEGFELFAGTDQVIDPLLAEFGGKIFVWFDYHRLPRILQDGVEQHIQKSLGTRRLRGLHKPDLLDAIIAKSIHIGTRNRVVARFPAAAFFCFIG